MYICFLFLYSSLAQPYSWANLILGPRPGPGRDRAGWDPGRDAGRVGPGRVGRWPGPGSGGTPGRKLGGCPPGRRKM